LIVLRLLAEILGVDESQIRRDRKSANADSEEEYGNGNGLSINGYSANAEPLDAYATLVADEKLRNAAERRIGRAADAASLGEALAEHAEICLHARYMRIAGLGCKLGCLSD
jgi:hypothetical protein